MSSILVVDDDPVLVTLLEAVLRGRGHEVVAAGDLAAARRALEGATFDLMILDIFMPDGSGLDVLRSLRARGDATPVIVLSGHRQEDFASSAARAGADRYMTKPFSPGELLTEVERLVA